MSDLSQFVKSATYEVGSGDEIERDAVIGILEEHDFAVIRGAIDPGDVRAGIDRLRERLDPALDMATTGEPPEAVYDNFQKFSIGCARHGGVDRPRFMRTIYNPIWAEDLYGLRETFARVARIRNLLTGVHPEFAISEPEDGMWTAARIHHFPSGGGFMVGHRDTVLPEAYKTCRVPDYFQLLLIMSEKGKDFETGGGFVEVRGKRLIYEDYCLPGDVAVYNASTVHGVEDIDTHRPFRQHSIAGRLSGLVTLFRDMRGGQAHPAQLIRKPA